MSKEEPARNSTFAGQPSELRSARLDIDFCLAIGRILFPDLDGVIPRELSGVWTQAKRTLRRSRACSRTIEVGRGNPERAATMILRQLFGGPHSEQQQATCNEEPERDL